MTTLVFGAIHLGHLGLAACGQPKQELSRSSVAKKKIFYADNLSDSFDTEVGKEEKGYKERQRITSDRSS